MISRAINPRDAINDHLSDAFQVFASAAGKLQDAYAELRSEAHRLRLEVQQRNAELSRSVAEKERLAGALGALVDTLPCGVVVLGASNQVLLANGEATRLLLCGCNAPVPAWSDFPTSFREIVAIDVASDPMFDRELRLEANGTAHWIAVRIRALSEAGDDKPGAAGLDAATKVVVIRDISAMKKAELERESCRNTVAMAEVAGILAHEIRNPLASIELFAGLLLSRTTLDQNARKWATQIQAGVRSTTATVNNVLQIHSLDCPAPVPVMVDQAIASAVEFVGPVAEQSGVILTMEPKAADAAISIEPNAFRQVLLNLTCNAFRHAGRLNSTVTIRSRARVVAGRYGVSVEVCDNGNGIASEHLDKIFEPGFSTTNSSPGLGLAVCKRIVEQYGGSIFVESEAGQGTTFHLEFPAQ